jgi:hypothetical protein
VFKLTIENGKSGEQVLIQKVERTFCSSRKSTYFNCISRELTTGEVDVIFLCASFCTLGLLEVRKKGIREICQKRPRQEPGAANCFKGLDLDSFSEKAKNI